MRHAAHFAVRNGAQFVLLGTAPDHRIGQQFWHLKRELNDSPDCHIELAFNEELSHLIYAGSDLMLVPSRYEPCGLTQLIALKYGTVPVVRAVGGLADSVFDKDFDHRPLDQRNGYVFEHYDVRAVEYTLKRAISRYYDYPTHFRDLIRNGMRADYSWNYPGQHYLNIYDHIRSK
ncbi:MAG: glycosyltransferase [Polyangiaceae bacterium]